MIFTYYSVVLKKKKGGKIVADFEWNNTNKDF
jgi:hypothetical protein